MRLNADERNASALCSEINLLAAEHLRMALSHAISAALREYGDGDGRLISGVYRGHFPEEVKEVLRGLNRDINTLEDSSVFKWEIAGKRMHTWRRMRDRIQTICNMARMYEVRLKIKKVRK